MQAHIGQGNGTYSNLFLSAFSLIVAIAVVELFLALFWPHKITTHPYHELYHPVMGWVNKPYSEGNVKTAANIFFHKKHNNQGLRSLRDSTFENPAGRKRILLVGDSFFWGYNVDDKDVISNVLQNMAGEKTEVINGAVPGYGTDQELLWLSEVGLKYRPDIIILGVFPTNDLSEISNSIMYGYPKPVFTIGNKGLLAMNIPVPDTRETRRKAFEDPDTFFGRLKKFFRHHTHIYPFIVGRLNSIPMMRGFFLKVGLAEEYTWTLNGVPRLSLKNIEESMRLMEALIMEITELSKENNADLLLVFIPAKETAPGDLTGYEGAGKDAIIKNNEFSRYFSSLASRNSMNYLDLLPVIREHQKKGEHLYTQGKYDHHWTPAGHKIAAEAVYGRLKDNSYLDK